MLSVAVGWQIYAITGRALDLGLIGLVQFVPSLVLALPAGHVADQFERRRIVLYGQVVEWMAIAMLAALTLLHGIHEIGILALVFVIGVAKAFEFPAHAVDAAGPGAAGDPAARDGAGLLRRTGGDDHGSGAGRLALRRRARRGLCRSPAVLYLASVILMAGLRYETRRRDANRPR